MSCFLSHDSEQNKYLVTEVEMLRAFSLMMAWQSYLSNVRVGERSILQSMVD